MFELFIGQNVIKFECLKKCIPLEVIWHMDGAEKNFVKK